MSALPPRGTFNVQQRGRGRGRGRGGGQAPQNTPAGGTPGRNSPGVTNSEDLEWIKAIVPKGCCRNPNETLVKDAKTTFVFDKEKGKDKRPALVVTGRRVEKLQEILHANFVENTAYELKIDEKSNSVIDIRIAQDPTPQQGGQRSGQ